MDQFKKMPMFQDDLSEFDNSREVVQSLVDEYKAEQVFIGRIGQSSLKTLLFGSVPAILVQISPVPVTVVP